MSARRLMIAFCLWLAAGLAWAADSSKPRDPDETPSSPSQIPATPSAEPVNPQPGSTPNAPSPSSVPTGNPSPSTPLPTPKPATVKPDRQPKPARETDETPKEDEKQQKTKRRTAPRKDKKTKPTAPKTAARPVPPPPIIPQRPRSIAPVERNLEFTLWSPNSQLAAALEVIIAAGGQERRRNSLNGFGPISLVTIRGPSTLRDLPLRQRLAAAAPAAELAPQDAYDLSQSPRLYADRMLNWPGPGRCQAIDGVRLGMIDGPVSVGQIYAGEVRLKRRSFLSKGRAPKRAAVDHGTGIAALLIGANEHHQLGLARGATLYAAQVFSRMEQGATIEAILRGMNWLLLEEVRLINLSFAGPRNRVLDLAADHAAKRGALLVAAAGRGVGIPSPAGATGTIAVSAVDAASRLEKGAAAGPYIEFVAPGVDLWLPRADGTGAYVSGSSFAAPVVTGLSARLLQQHPNLSPALLRGLLKSNVDDLGTPGRDPQFGWGLVKAEFTC